MRCFFGEDDKTEEEEYPKAFSYEMIQQCRDASLAVNDTLVRKYDSLNTLCTCTSRGLMKKYPYGEAKKFTEADKPKIAELMDSCKINSNSFQPDSSKTKK